LRPQLRKLTPWFGIAAAYALMLTVTVLGSALVFELDHQLDLGLTLPTQFESRFIWRSAALCALIAAALLRYFFVLQQWRARVRAEAKARFDALQARIRPHFLFNSMNTIASLIRVRPAEAENAVENLSDLFRAALGHEAHSTLGEELDLVRRYLDIEKLRLGERLRVDLRVDDLPADMPLPSLLLQPLVENAVYHGVQQMPEGGVVSIHGRSEDKSVTIEIRNPCPQTRVAKRHGMALENTRARIEYHFGARGKLHVESAADTFTCIVQLPLTP
jgi:two-component system sensor histidine kinase AlgZ